ncbi:transposase [Roseomonas sp. BU-1]|uniref:Transposase n=1 Tax=Falsiroseomonas selenitidurans TaxID=2716335 RepID=A0ABX1E331_9PROT|nr:transposase [Falsiroseomonas selenitidurans]
MLSNLRRPALRPCDNQGGHKADAINFIRETVASGSVVHADKAAGLDKLHAFYEAKRINQPVAYSLNGACTNQAESFLSRLRSAEWGQHRHISGQVPCRLRCRDGVARR